MKNFVLSKETKLLAYKINNGIFSPYFISIIYRFFRWNSPFFVSRCIAINDSTINAQTTKISDYVIYRFCGFRENIVSLFFSDTLCLQSFSLTLIYFIVKDYWLKRQAIWAVFQNLCWGSLQDNICWASVVGKQSYCR